MWARECSMLSFQSLCTNVTHLLLFTNFIIESVMSVYDNAFGMSMTWINKFSMYSNWKLTWKSDDYFATLFRLFFLFLFLCMSVNVSMPVDASPINVESEREENGFNVKPNTYSAIIICCACITYFFTVTIYPSIYNMFDGVFSISAGSTKTKPNQTMPHSISVWTHVLFMVDYLN